jgi:hypothetical protein
MRMNPPAYLLLTATLLACGCAAPCGGQARAHQGPVTDIDAFQAFIAGRPTPDQFRAAYPDVRLILPGQMATKEYRTDRSRYFAELDGEGRIQGGRFQ